MLKSFEHIVAVLQPQFSEAEIQSVIPVANRNITSVAFDSRRITEPESALFVALKGSRDGSVYISHAYEQGVRCFLADNHFHHTVLPDACFVKVPDVLKALCMLAAANRQTFSGPLLGITGSNGKTIVKEWLYHLLKKDFVISRSPRSYNSTLGVAISLLGIEKYHNLALIEAGISNPGDMDPLVEMMQPNVGVLTHLGTAHDEGFDSRQQKAKEKCKLFAECDVVVYPYDCVEIRNEIGALRQKQPLMKTYSWGFAEGASYRINSATVLGQHTRIQFTYRSIQHEISIPFTDKASVENAMTSLCVLSALERWDPEHLQLFESLPRLENRMAFMEGKNGNYLVNDSYSNDLDSLEVAVDFLHRQQPGIPHLAIISDLEQSDPDKTRLYARVAALFAEKGVKEVVGVGAEIGEHAALFGSGFKHFGSTKELLASDFLNTITGRAVLIKGARSFELEKATRRLQKQLHQTVLQINLNALKHNYNVFKSSLNSGTKLMAMVKAFAYGSGSFEAARALQYMGADYFGVAYTDEGVSLRKSGITKPIMVMNAESSDAGILYEYGLEPVVFSVEQIKGFADAGIALNVHLEIDTGMHRLGFGPDEVEKAVLALGSHMRVAGVFSHLSASESPDFDDFTRQQIQLFKDACKRAEELLSYPFLKHISNTGGALRFPDAQMDMVRIGIGLYGVNPVAGDPAGLTPVLALKTVISQIKTIPAGDSVGYSRKSISSHERKIAVLPIGYADGLMRAVGNGVGYVSIAGLKAPYAGNICMDMCMVDVTDIACAEGDEVEVFGSCPSVDDLSAWCSTIPYEILPSISQRVRREFVGEN